MKNKSVLLRSYLLLKEVRKTFEDNPGDTIILDSCILDLLDDIWEKLTQKEKDWLNSRQTSGT